VITEDLEARFLKTLYRRYTKAFGYGSRNLNEKEFLILDTSFEKEIPDIAVNNETGMRKFLTTDLVMELKSKGLVRTDSLSFYLTEAGYSKANKSWFERKIEYFTNNAGWAIPISAISTLLALASLLVAIIALYK
jgi:hypothetical protein